MRQSQQALSSGSRDRSVMISSSHMRSFERRCIAICLPRVEGISTLRPRERPPDRQPSVIGWPRVEVTDDDLATELEELAQTEFVGGATSAAADHLVWAAELSSNAQSREARLLAAVGAMVFARDEARARSFISALEDCTDEAGL